MQQPNILAMLLPLLKPKKLIDRIKEAYPNPKKLGEIPLLGWTKESYCILQAAHMFFGGSSGGDKYWEVLDNQNTTHPSRKGMAYERSIYYAACNITSLNDTGHFEEAWELLGKNLPKY